MKLVTVLICALLCVVIWSLANRRRRARSITHEPSASQATPSREAHNPARVAILVAITGAFYACLTAVTVAIRREPGISIWLIVAAPVIGAVILAGIACLVQGARLRNSPQHRSLGVFAMAVAIVPAVFWVGINLLLNIAEPTGTVDVEPKIRPSAWVEIGGVGATDDGAQEYRQISGFFSKPRPLERAYVDDEGVVLVFSGSLGARAGVEVHVLANEPEDFAKFCNESLVGMDLSVEVPDLQRFLSEGAVRVYCEGEKINYYWEHREQEKALSDLREQRKTFPR